MNLNLQTQQVTVVASLIPSAPFQFALDSQKGIAFLFSSDIANNWNITSYSISTGKQLQVKKYSRTQLPLPLGVLHTY